MATLGTAIGLALLLILLVRRQIVVRVTELANAVRALEDNKGVEPTVTVVYDDEIGKLAQAFDKMGKSVVEREKRLEEEFEIATRIQMSILPDQLAVCGLELAPCMHPATELDGDYYAVLPVEDGAWLGIGDISGHGLNAGLVMPMIQSAVAGVVRQNAFGSPRDFPSALNDVLVDDIRERLKTNGHATLFLFRYTTDGKSIFAGAHEAIMIYRAAEQRIEWVPTPGRWVGIAEAIARTTEECTLVLHDRDVMVLYTDGLTEAGNEEGELFGEQRFEAAVLEVAEKNVEEI